MMVRLRVANIDKTLRISGDRGALRLGGPKPFGRMPVVYERAFGGTTEAGDVYLENPVGLGYKGAKPLDPTINTEAPNIGPPTTTHADGATIRRPLGLVSYPDIGHHASNSQALTIKRGLIRYGHCHRTMSILCSIKPRRPINSLHR